MAYFQRRRHFGIYWAKYLKTTTHLALNRTCICFDSFSLPHLRSLVSLDLKNLPEPSNVIDNADLTLTKLDRAYSTSDICAILNQEGIYLKLLIVSDVGVFDYLCSYSGLETLDLCSMSFNSVKESNTSTRTLYKTVLPHLVHSLEVLKIQPKHVFRSRGRLSVCCTLSVQWTSIAVCRIELYIFCAVHYLFFSGSRSPSVQRQSW